MCRVIHHLLDVLAVTIVTTTSFGIGHLVLGKRLGLGRLETLVFGTAVGAGVLAISILVFGSLGLWHPVPLAGLLLCWLLIGKRGVASLPGLVARSLEAVGRGTYPLGFVLLSSVATFLILESLAPPTDWDSLMYHLDLPAAFTREGRLFRPPDSVHFGLVGLIHMLYVPLLAFGTPSAPALLSAVFSLLLMGGVYSLCARVLDSSTARYAPPLIFGTTSLLLVASTGRVDVTLTLYLFLAHYALIIDAREGRPRRLWLVGLLMGFALGVKYQALIWATALAPLVIWLLADRAIPRKPKLSALGSAGLLFLVCAGPWLLKNVLYLGAPLYPFFTDRPPPSWLAGIVDPATLAGIDSSMYELLRQVREPFNLSDLFFSPGALTAEAEGAFYFTNPLLALSPLALLFLRDRLLALLAIPPALYLTILLVAFPETSLRYLIPAVPALTILCVEIVTRWSHRIPLPSLRRGLLGMIALGAMLPALWTMLVWLSGRKALDHAVGRMTEREYIANALPRYDAVMRFVNEELPGSGKILMLLEARGFYFERPVVHDYVLANLPLLAHGFGDRTCPSPSHIEYVLLNLTSVPYYSFKGLDLADLRWDWFPGFVERCLDEVYVRDGFAVFRVRGGPRENPVESGTSSLPGDDVPLRIEVPAGRDAATSHGPFRFADGVTVGR